jgi:outer membrane immunogenic protein
MRRFHCAALAAVAVFGFASVASAADMPVKATPLSPPVYSWTGFYIGGHIGADWGRDKATVIDNNPVDVTAPFSQNATGIFGGGQFGYNWQQNNIVFGVEADFGGLGLNSSVFRNNVVNTIGFQTNTSSGFYGDVTGRLGYGR